MLSQVSSHLVGCSPADILTEVAIDEPDQLPGYTDSNKEESGCDQRVRSYPLRKWQ